MPIGLTGCKPPSNNGQNNVVVKSEIKGWSASSSRNNAKWLMSRDPIGLPAGGVCFSLTLGDCPPSPVEWKDRLDRFLSNDMRAVKPLALHWVMEFQVKTRFCPHIHVLIFPSPASPSNWVARVFDAWLARMSAWNPRSIAQHASRLEEAGGWFGYVAKHSARSIKQVQRQRASIPASWGGFTGRVWGYRGDWAEPVSVPVAAPDMATFHQFRRIARRWARSKIRPELWRSMHRARPRDPDAGEDLDAVRRFSTVRGFSAWLPIPATARLLRFLVASGHTLWVDHHLMEQLDRDTGKPLHPFFPLSLLGLPRNAEEAMCAGRA